MDQNSNITENELKHNPDETEDYLKCLRSPSFGYYDEKRTHSQTHCLMTTVPQNIASLNIAGKHAPTRHSLRHSRMVVMNKTRRVPVNYLPMVAKNHEVSKTIARIIFIIGVCMCALSVWLLIWTPNIKPEDNPFYSAIPILVSGIFGLMHVYCCRREFPGVRRNACEKSIKVLSICTSLFSTTMSFLYFFYGLIHLLSFSHLICEPPNFLNASCLCRLTDSSMENSWLNNSYHYVDLTCWEVTKILNALIMFFCLINLLTISLQIFYLKLHWKNRVEISSFKKCHSSDT